MASEYETFEETLYPPDLAMSPFFAIARFRSMLRKYGEKRVLEDVKFKKAREVWITATFLLGFSTLTEKEYWVLPEHREPTPDTYGLSVAAHPDRPQYKTQDRMSIEVVEWESHGEQDLLDAIQRKLARKKYPSDFVLLIYGRRPGEMVDLEKVFSSLGAGRANISVSEIWLLGNVEGVNPDHHIIVRLYPDRAQREFMVNEQLERRSGQKEMVRFIRGTGDDDTIAEEHYIPLPPFP